jgi:hypothetical protein
MYTVRIFDEDTHTDATYATAAEAFTAVYGEPVPLTETSEPVISEAFAIFNEAGVCFHVIGETTELLGSSL